jgi:cytochrome P450/NADPH-cytochrome P450 reductase
MRREADAVWRLIDAGAVVFVCGDGSRMEPDVKRALADIFSERSAASKEAGETWVAGLAEAGRYVLDVWSNA